MKIELVADRVQDKEAIEKYLKNHDMAYSLQFRKGEPYLIGCEINQPLEDFFTDIKNHLLKYKHVKKSGLKIKFNF